MPKLPILAIAASLIASPALADTNLEKGFHGALRGCEEWVLNPASWAEGPGQFIETVGLGQQMGLVEQVDEVNLPPEQLRRGNLFWRINSTPNAGFVLVVSAELPMCHITGGGGVDLQPSIEAVLASPDFRERWEAGETTARAGMATTVFRNREEPALSMTLSRAEDAGERLDRVQVLATAMYDIGG